MPRFHSFPAVHQEFVIGRFDVANMGDDGQTNGVLIQSLCGGRTTDPAAVFGARVFGYGRRRLGRASGIELANAFCKLLDVGEVQFRPALRLTHSTLRPGALICQTFDFGLCQSRFLDQESLAFVTLSGLAPLQDNGRESGVLSRTASQCGVAGGEKDEMVEVRAG